MRESVGIDLVGSGLQSIARSVGVESARSEHLPQPRDVHLKGLRRCDGLLRAVEILEQALGRNDLVPPQKQDREQSPRSGPAELDRATVVLDLEWAQHSEFHVIRRNRCNRPAADLQPCSASVRSVDRTGRSKAKEEIVKAHQRFIGALVLSLATTVVMVGPAQAQHPNDRGGMLGIGGAADGADGRAVIPNDRAGKLGIGGIESQTLQLASVRPDDRGSLRGPGAVATASTVTAVADDGFQWRDAGFEAAAAFGIALLGIVGALTLRQHRRVLVR
jgi:hypothetical protein